MIMDNKCPTKYKYINKFIKKFLQIHTNPNEDKTPMEIRKLYSTWCGEFFILTTSNQYIKTLAALLRDVFLA